MKKNILKIGLDPLLHFESIARHKSLKRAADELGLSQPAVTQSLSKLEKNLETQLCVRSRAAFELTETGKRLYQTCKEIKDDLKNYEAFLSDEKEFDGHLGIGVIDNFQNKFLDKAVRRTIQTFPKMKLSIQVHPATEIQNLLISGQIDIGLGIFNRKLESLTYRKVGSETINFYISESHPLWNRREITSDHLKDTPQTWVDIISRDRAALDNEIFKAPGRKNTRISCYTNNLNAALLVLQSGTSIVPLPAEYLQSRKLRFKYRALDAILNPFSLNQEIAMHRNFLNASAPAVFFLSQFPQKI